MSGEQLYKDDNSYNYDFLKKKFLTSEFDLRFIPALLDRFELDLLYPIEKPKL